MAKKGSTFTRRMILANVGLVLAVSSLFGVGFAAWQEVGEPTSANASFDINVANKGVELVDYYLQTDFVIYKTGAMQNATQNTEGDENRSFTTTPFIEYILVYNIPSNTSGTFKIDLSLTAKNSDNTDVFNIGNELATDYFINYSQLGQSNIDIPTDNYTNNSLNYTIETLSFATHLKVRIKWILEVPANYSYTDFYTNIGTKCPITINLEVYSWII